MKLYTLKDAQKWLNVGEVTLRKYCRRKLIGMHIGCVPVGPDRRPWYLTEEDLAVVKAIPRQAHKAGRPKIGEKRWLHEQSDRH